MKTRETANAERRPYHPPVVERQSDLKKITLYTDVFGYGDPDQDTGGGGGGRGSRMRDSR